MQSSVITSAFSSGCCSRSIKAAISSRVGTRADGCAIYSVLGMRRRGNLSNSALLRAYKKSFRERIGSRYDGVVVVRAELDQSGGGSLYEKLEDYNSEKAVDGMQEVDQSGRGSLDEKLKDLDSGNAVDGIQGFDRSARLMVDKLKPVEHPGTTRDLELQAEEKAFETDESFGGKELVLDVASDSAVDPEHAHEHTVATAGEIAPELGLCEEDLTTALEDRADEASSRDAELLKTDTSTGQPKDGVGQVFSATEESGEIGDVFQKIVFVTAEVLKWARESAKGSGANSRGELKVTQEIFVKRLNSFNFAAEDTKEVGAQFSEVSRRYYKELQRFATRFGLPSQVKIEDKKALGELKPDSETSPLGKSSRGVQASIDDVSLLFQSLQENVVKLSIADESSEVTDRLVPVGEKEGFFQDLAPAEGSSLTPGDTSAEASDILGQHNVADEEAGEKEDSQEYDGYFGNTRVNRFVSFQNDDREQTLTTGGDSSTSKREEDHQEHERLFGDIPVDSSSASSSATADTDEQTPTTSGKASAHMRELYEHEVGNVQLKEIQELGPYTSYGADASSQHDPASLQPSVKDKDGMGIGPDE